MRWTARGVESILRLILVRYTNEECYDAFFAAQTNQAATEELTQRLDLTCSGEISAADIGKLPKEPRSMVANA
jgi:hypothetical protein